MTRLKNLCLLPYIWMMLFMLTGWGCSSGSDEEPIVPQLSVNVRELAVKSAGETVSVQVTCNVPYEVSLPCCCSLDCPTCSYDHHGEWSADTHL